MRFDRAPKKLKLRDKDAGATPLRDKGDGLDKEQAK